MKFTVQVPELRGAAPVRIGNVYPCRGGRPASLGYMHILIAIAGERFPQGQTGLFLTVNRDGEPVGVTQYGMHVVTDWTPVGFVDGLDDLELTIRAE